MSIDAVIFDLGGTLIEYAGPFARWPDLETPGFQAAYSSLLSKGIELPAFERFQTAGFDMLPLRWQMATSGRQNLRLAELLQEVLEHCNLSDVNRTWIDEAAADYQNAICAQAESIEAAEETLVFIKNQGYKIGLLSNTMFSGAAHIADLQRFGLDSYFDALLFSADAGKWKPSAEPFLELLNRLEADPQKSVFVGDDPASDMVGAQRAGMSTVYFRSSQRFERPEGVYADAEITHLSELPPILEGWANG